MSKIGTMNEREKRILSDFNIQMLEYQRIIINKYDEGKIGIEKATNAQNKLESWYWVMHDKLLGIF